ncbi:hypothetical protein EV702DRAFT_221930 [Suillus placidus]|uniref:Uncharacterized protein n=1 Tax=Suillus placidus TaxID=48579 RepID=A0A9P6ZXS9_9AGAM|nr:hypothetical protein EV702DRAFT_221930 [Suillus placidus]
MNIYRNCGSVTVPSPYGRGVNPGPSHDSDHQSQILTKTIRVVPVPSAFYGTLADMILVLVQLCSFQLLASRCLVTFPIDSYSLAVTALVLIVLSYSIFYPFRAQCKSACILVPVTIHVVLSTVGRSRARTTVSRRTASMSMSSIAGLF